MKFNTLIKNAHGTFYKIGNECERVGIGDLLVWQDRTMIGVGYYVPAFDKVLSEVYMWEFQLSSLPGETLVEKIRNEVLRVFSQPGTYVPTHLKFDDPARARLFARGELAVI